MIYYYGTYKDSSDKNKIVIFKNTINIFDWYSLSIFGMVNIKNKNYHINGTIDFDVYDLDEFLKIL